MKLICSLRESGKGHSREARRPAAFVPDRAPAPSGTAISAGPGPPRGGKISPAPCRTPALSGRAPRPFSHWLRRSPRDQPGGDSVVAPWMGAGGRKKHRMRAEGRERRFRSCALRGSGTVTGCVRQRGPARSPAPPAGGAGPAGPSGGGGCPAPQAPRPVRAFCLRPPRSSAPRPRRTGQDER